MTGRDTQRKILERRAAFVSAALAACSGCGLSSTTRPGPVQATEHGSDAQGTSATSVGWAPGSIGDASFSAEKVDSSPDAGNSQVDHGLIDGGDDRDARSPVVAVVCLSIRITPRARFKHGRAELSLEGRRLLDEVARVLQDRSELRIVIEGHADGSEGVYASRLAARRAAAAKKYLRTRGIDLNRLCARSFGANRPLTSGKTPNSRKANRRVEFRVMPPDESCKP